MADGVAMAAQAACAASARLVVVALSLDFRSQQDCGQRRPDTLSLVLWGRLRFWFNGSDARPAHAQKMARFMSIFGPEASSSLRGTV